MYLGDSDMVHNHINDDWTVLIRNIKLRQQIYHQLFELNKQIIQKQKWAEQPFDFLAQTVIAHHQKMSSFTQQHNQMCIIEKEIAQKYDKAIISFEDCIKLMARIGTKIIQIFNSTLEQDCNKNSLQLDQFNRFKNKLNSLINQKEQLNLEKILNLVLEYSKGKLESELLKFQRFIIAINTKQFQQIKHINDNNIKKRKISHEQPKQLSLQKKRQFSFSKEERQQVKKKQKQRKMKQKTLQVLYSVIQLSKNHVWQQISGAEEERSNKLYLELLTRNKRNNQHIVRFSSQKELWEKKIELFEGIIKSEPIQYSNNTFTEIIKINEFALNTKYNGYVATEADYYHTITENIDFQFTQNNVKQFVKSRANSPIPKKDLPNIFNRTTINIDLFSSFKFEQRGKQEGIKSRLPQINRGISLDNKSIYKIPRKSCQGDIKEQLDNMEENQFLKTRKKEKSNRDEKFTTPRTKMVLKSVEVGLDLCARKCDRRQEITTLRERKKTDTSSQEMTIQAKRTLNKFIDSKFNVFF